MFALVYGYALLYDCFVMIVVSMFTVVYADRHLPEALPSAAGRPTVGACRDAPVLKRRSRPYKPMLRDAPVLKGCTRAYKACTRAQGC